ncbi:variable surface lipoprotein [Mycoplasmopsis agalactiae]|nr:variable surface lipoprotein [Mycoplasmopsis agalactiae]MCE6056599.1 variable surface lipoprotein [Mycoplasmopsis agalactiae]
MKKKFLIAGGIVSLVLPLVSARCNDTKTDNNSNSNPTVTPPSTSPAPNPNNNSARSESSSKTWDSIYDNSPTGADITSNVSYKVMFEKYKQTLLTSISSIDKKIVEIDKKSSLLEKQHQDDIVKRKSDFEANKTALEAEINKNNNDIESLEETVLAKAKGELKETTESIKDLEDILLGAQEEKDFYSKLTDSDKDFLTKKVEEIKKRIEDTIKLADTRTDANLKELKDKLEALNKEISDPSNKSLEYVKKYYTIIYDQSIKTINVFIVEGKKREQKSEADVKDFENRLSELKQKAKELQSKLENLKQTAKSISELEKKYEQEELDLERQIYKYEEDKNHRQRKIEELDKSIKEIEKLSKK